jgi:hypothetical protein
MADTNNAQAVMTETKEKPVMESKQKKSKMDRTKMTEEEKKLETTRQNNKRKIQRQKEIEQEHKAVQARHISRDHRIKIAKQLCSLLNLDPNNSGSETLGKELKTELETFPEDENLDDYNASDFDSSDSDGEDDFDAGDETDDEVDEEERQLFKIAPWNRKKYENLSITIEPDSSTDKITIQGMDASMSTVFRKIMNEEIKQDNSTDNINVTIKSKYPMKHMQIIKLYCEMHQGLRQIYKIERPMNNGTILESCIPIELNTADAKVLGYPIGRQSIDDAKIQATYDVIFYELMRVAKIDLFKMLEITDYYNVVGFKELLAAVPALLLKKIDSLIETGGLTGMAKSLINSLIENCGDTQTNFDEMLANLIVECEKEIATSKEAEAVEAAEKKDTTTDKKDNDADKTKE